MNTNGNRLTKSGFAPVAVEVEVNGQTCIVAVDEFKGNTYLSARLMYVNKQGELKHGSNGINIRIDGEEGMEAALIIIEAMQQALTLTHQEVEELEDPDADSSHPGHPSHYGDK